VPEISAQQDDRALPRHALSVRWTLLQRSSDCSLAPTGAQDYGAGVSRHRAFFAGLTPVLIIATAVALALVRGGISARSEPSTTEARVARTVRHWAIPADARERANPVAVTAAVLTDARAHFADHCAVCHGNDGGGDTHMGRNLYPRAPDMRLPATQALSDGELFYIIENGVRLTGMPAWATSGSEEESWKLVHFIRHLPRLAPKELIEMERLNPRSAAEWRELEEEDQFLRGEGDEGRRDERGQDHRRLH
jgi:mono/diheme cytochrome c family protein